MFLSKDNRLKWNWIISGFLITVLCVLACANWFDIPLHNYLSGYNGPFLNFIDMIFETKVWVIVSFLVFAICYILRKKFNLDKLRTAAFLVFCSVMGSAAIVAILKFAFGRMRPVFYDALGSYGFIPFSNGWALNSFPSGHTASAFAGLVMIGMFYPRAKPGTWTLAILIGISRVCAGVHWPADVIAAAFIGMVVADFVKGLRFKV